MPSKYTDLNRSNAIELYSAGMSARATATKLGLNADFVSRLIRREGLSRDLSSARRKFFERGGEAPTFNTAIDADEICREYELGVCAQKLSEKHGVSDKLIQVRLRRAGVHVRSPAEARALIDRKQATTKGAEARSRKVGWGEDVLAQWLTDRGEVPDLQRPEGTRNVDIAVGSIAVEVWLSSSSPLTDPYCRKRIEYLADRGLTICYVLVARRTRTLLPSVADQIVALAQEAHRDPSAPRQHRVIRGCGEVAAVFGDDLDDVAFMPPSRDCPHHHPRHGRRSD